VAHNVEIKARARDFEKQRMRAQALSSAPPEYLVQEDTFFNVPAGRLKLRKLADGTAELIQYDREDSRGPRESRYIVLRTADPESLKQVLAKGLGIRAVVRKKRTVYFFDKTRIHLDEVEGLGSFIELEVVLGPDDGIPTGSAVAEDLMLKLGIEKEDLVAGAYVDLEHSIHNAGRRGEKHD
jgi:predicted adenylyl cyclase CyaB